MTDEEIREGDIVEIDYIACTNEHINEGKALVIWKGFNQQPLVRKLDTKTTIWTCYEQIAKVVGHIDIEGYMDKALEQEDILDKIRAEILEERECAYADFERYKVEYLGQDWEDVLDSLPQDDFRYGMERVIEIIDNTRKKARLRNEQTSR